MVTFLLPLVMFPFAVLPAVSGPMSQTGASAESRQSAVASGPGANVDCAAWRRPTRTWDDPPLRPADTERLTFMIDLTWNRAGPKGLPFFTVVSVENTEAIGKIQNAVWITLSIRAVFPSHWQGKPSRAA